MRSQGVPLVSRQQEWVEALHLCENSQDVPRIVDSNGLYSYGYVEFQMGTWLHYGAALGATPQNIDDPQMQQIVAISMLNQGLWRNWYTCTTKHVVPTLGNYPLPPAVE